MTLPKAFLERMEKRQGIDLPAFLESYKLPPWKGLRVNTLKISEEDFLSRSPFSLSPVPWEESGFYYTAEKAGAHPYHFAGLYYLQEPSAMMTGALAKNLPKERVLDLCAAPGGKTTQIAAQMAGRGVLVANEVDLSRAKILSQNVERCGISNCAVTNATPEALAERFPAYFDLVVVDAPCSGEGMFKKEPNAIPEWSEENVSRCALRQKRILGEAAKTVAGGGHLLYSTCTFAEEEDEWQIEAFLKERPEFTLVRQEKLYPHTVRGEGHFCALLQKTDGERLAAKVYPASKNTAAERAFSEFELFEGSMEGQITTLPDGRMYLVPDGMPDLKVRLLRLGTELGEFDGKRFKPAHALAMAMGERAKRKLSLSLPECEPYLRGETLQGNFPDGWCVVCAEEFPLGFGKCVGGVVKNHLPKALRLYEKKL